MRARGVRRSASCPCRALTRSPAAPASPSASSAPRAGSCFAHALVKTVKLWERPTPHELVKQLEVVLAKMPEIHASGQALNIWMERDANAAHADKPDAGPALPASTGIHSVSSGVGALAAAAVADVVRDVSG